MPVPPKFFVEQRSKPLDRNKFYATLETMVEGKTRLCADFTPDGIAIQINNSDELLGRRFSLSPDQAFRLGESLKIWSHRLRAELKVKMPENLEQELIDLDKTNAPARAFVSAMKAIYEFSNEAAPNPVNPVELTSAMLARAFETFARATDTDHPPVVRHWLLRQALAFSFVHEVPEVEVDMTEESEQQGAPRTTVHFTTEENTAIEEILCDLPTMGIPPNAHQLALPVVHTNYLLAAIFYRLGNILNK